MGSESCSIQRSPEGQPVFRAVQRGSASFRGSPEWVSQSSRQSREGQPEQPGPVELQFHGTGPARVQGRNPAHRRKKRAAFGADRIFFV